MSEQAAESNSPHPRFFRDGFALGLFGLTLLILVSVVTRDSGDPILNLGWPLANFYQPDTLEYPIRESTQNACGALGALISGVFIDNLGISVSLVIAAMGGATTALMMRGQMNAPVLRSAGGCLVIPASASAAAMLPFSLTDMSVYGNGGRLGAMISTYLLDHFAPIGAWILTLTVMAVGMLLVTDYALLIAGRKIVAGGKMVSAASVRKAASVLPELRRRRQPFTDLESPILLEGEQWEDEEKPASSLVDAGEAVADELISEPTIRVKTPKKRLSLLSTPETEDVAADNDVEADASEYEDETEEDFDGDGDWEDDADSEGESEGEAEEEEDAPPVREVEMDGETIQVRLDAAETEVPAPRIRTARRKREDAEENPILEGIVESSPSHEDYHLPRIELLTQSDDISYDDQLDEVRRKAKILEQAFKSFGYTIRVVEIETGPVIAQYEIELEAGLRLSKITGLAEDIAIALRVPSVRIVAPIPGKNTVGIEVPNETRQVVRLRDVIEDSAGKSGRMNIPVFLGQDVSGNPLVVDLAKMPHLLIAGRTGTGKSVCLNAIICSILMCCRPDEVRLLMIDPKMVELSGYGRLPHLMHPVITDMKKAEAILAWAVDKMEERYSLLAKVGVRHINSYNDLGRDEVLRRLEIDEDDEPTDVPERLPFIVIVADEMADLMMTAGKDVEQHIIRLAQKSRAVGIHLILATQKPTVDVITGLIKSNLPARLSFQVASKTDSRVVLDENGADKLLGNGDMLFLWPGTSTLIRGQGTYLSDEEIDAICNHCSTAEQNFVGELMELPVPGEEGAGETTMDQIKQRDELYDSAIEVVIREGRGSCSLLQRCLGIGYGRAAKLIDYMAEDGIVGDYNGSKAREVIMTMDQWLKVQGIEPDNELEGKVEEEGEEKDDAAEYSPPFESDEEYEDYE